jgi:hypothetical protein
MCTVVAYASPFATLDAEICWWIRIKHMFTGAVPLKSHRYLNRHDVWTLFHRHLKEFFAKLSQFLLFRMLLLAKAITDKNEFLDFPQNQCCGSGSGIRCFLPPDPGAGSGIWYGKKIQIQDLDSGRNISDLIFDF